MRVGRPHGLDGSFYLEGPGQAPAVGDTITVGDLTTEVERRAGTDAKPILRVTGIGDRDAAETLRGRPVADTEETPLEEGEWLVEDLIGCSVDGLGEVTNVMKGLSCDVLEVGGHLVPLVTDAVVSVDIEAKRIEVNREFLGLGEAAGGSARDSR